MRKVVFIIASLALAAAAHAQSSRIAFISAVLPDYRTQVFLINPDGSGKQQLTQEPVGYVRAVAWSPDGTKIAYVYDDNASNGCQLVVVNADGSNRRVITTGIAEPLAWSPDGGKIAVSGLTHPWPPVMIVDVATGQKSQYANATGILNSWAPGHDLMWASVTYDSNYQPILHFWRNTTAIQYNGADRAQSVAEAADGRLAWQTENFDLVITDANGGNGRKIASNIEGPAWSYDGQYIGFDDPANGIGDPTPISVIRADGTQLRQISWAPGGSMEYADLTWQGSGAAAPSDDTKLTVNNSRYNVALTARDQRTGKTGVGKANLQTDVFGYFSIPDLTGDPSNPEVFVKVLGPVGNVPWVFFGGLTDLEYTITVTDNQNGIARQYHKDAGSPKGGFDTGSGQGPAGECGALKTDEFTGGKSPLGCSASDKSLCLLNNRFRVMMHAKDQRTGKEADGVTLAKNNLFGFFRLPDLTGDPNNVEAFVKMIDGTSVNGHFWVFFGGLTDLQYYLSVTDMTTGRTKMYYKDPGSACGGFDTGAF